MVSRAVTVILIMRFEVTEGTVSMSLGEAGAGRTVGLDRNDGSVQANRALKVSVPILGGQSIR